MLHCINCLLCLVCMCCVWPQHFSISNAGISSNNGKSQSSSYGNGSPVHEATAPLRKFSEGPLPVVSPSNEPVGGVGGSGLPPAKDDGGGGSVKSDGVISEGAAPKKDRLMSMKPPSLPPHSKLKEASAMPPPPSLPARFAKGVYCV